VRAICKIEVRFTPEDNMPAKTSAPAEAEDASALEVAEAEVVSDLAPKLPGEGAVDEELLNHAVAEINRIYVSKGLEMARDLGNYVVDVFFGGDVGSFGRREKHHVTFRALARHDDLRVSYTTIYYSVAILDQLRLLPDDLAEALPVTHHKHLVPVRDAEMKVELAARAVDENLSSRAFAEVVKEARAAQAIPRRGGRRPLPESLKALRRLNEAIASAASRPITPESLEEISGADIGKLVLSLDVAMEVLASLKARILAATKERGDSE
jgi:hypothetical protein